MISNKKYCLTCLPCPYCSTISYSASQPVAGYLVLFWSSVKTRTARHGGIIALASALYLTHTHTLSLEGYLSFCLAAVVGFRFRSNHILVSDRIGQYYTCMPSLSLRTFWKDLSYRRCCGHSDRSVSPNVVKWDGLLSASQATPILLNSHLTCFGRLDGAGLPGQAACQIETIPPVAIWGNLIP